MDEAPDHGAAWQRCVAPDLELRRAEEHGAHVHEHPRGVTPLALRIWLRRRVVGAGREQGPREGRLRELSQREGDRERVLLRVLPHRVAHGLRRVAHRAAARRDQDHVREREPLQDVGQNLLRQRGQSQRWQQL